MKILSFMIGVLFCMVVSAQQDIQFTQHMFNALPLNPGYAGHKNITNLNVLYRNQWSGESIEGTPRTMLVSIDGRIEKKHLGLAFHLMKDQLGAQSNISAYSSVSYRIRFSEKEILSIGIAFGATQYQLDGTLMNPLVSSDNAVPGATSHTISPDAKFGIYLSNDRYFIGISAANIFNDNINYTGDIRNIVGKQRLHYYLMAGKLFPVSGHITIFPSFLIKEDFRGPTNLDLNSYFLIENRIWFGVGYRTALNIFSKPLLQTDLQMTNAATLSTRIPLNEKMQVGYSYDFTISSLYSYVNGSHEISIRYFLHSNSNLLRTENATF